MVEVVGVVGYVCIVYVCIVVMVAVVVGVVVEAQVLDLLGCAGVGGREGERKDEG